jgi:hypothetical protein
MVILQNDPAAMTMASRVIARSNRDFDANRPLGFEIRSIMDMAKRPYDFESFRMLHYDIIIEDSVTSQEKAKELNIQGVKLYKEGKLDEAQWCFEKALSIDHDYDNAKKNLTTLNAKIGARKDRMNKEAKEGKSFAEVSKEIAKESASRAGPVAEEQPEAQVAQPGYQGPSRAQQGYEQVSYQQADYQQADYQKRGYQQAAYGQQAPAAGAKPQYGQKNFRCPGCGIPVKPDWVMCTNCGTDLRQYPPIPF